MNSFLLYIDPAATSVLISSLTAIVVAVAATAIVLWRKVKNKVTKTLRIDPNAHKEVEDELVVNDEVATPTEPEKSSETTNKKKNKAN